ncbi:hypothetical protein [Pseudofrankia sp. BMG5.36]|uniref:Tc toxin subunit A-related protein n=1 Tax=Pseudofrankia sp. BMG5.36 TaxID=1834512 RepID=UPI0008DAFD3C|nr:hypothetical protein [Pseudofrankia sp. BMG5.36]OHV58801.1 hypothetical protein BCD48_41870 [Pseudofrankia sp. BMG5.36]
MTPFAFDDSLGLHGAVDRSLSLATKAPANGARQETYETRPHILRERELRYRVSLHAHPYAEFLARRLAREGVAGLQAADTEYAEGGPSLPESVEVALPAGTALTVPADVAGTLLVTDPVTIPTTGAVDVELAGSTRLRFQGPASVTTAGELRVTLVAGLADTPPPGSPVTLAGQPAFLPADAALSCAGATVALLGGLTGTLPAQSRVLLQRGTELRLAAGTAATLRASRQVPKDLYQDLMTAYAPTSLVERPRPARDLDFSSNGAYAVYNWELFFHAPLTMAVHLSKNGHFAEAQRWLHYLFDPTDTSDGPTPARFWKVRPFQSTDVERVADLLTGLAGPDSATRRDTAASLGAWERNPFRPHAVARFRPQAYMYKTVMTYLDNLIAWGDSLFRQDTGEAVDEALTLYLLAASILGPRPNPVPTSASARPRTYASLSADLKKFGTVLQGLEPVLPFDLLPLPADDPAVGAGDAVPAGSGGDARGAVVRSIGQAPYFCVPPNDKLLGYWDTVADRLFKIRNSLNLQGVFRQLALFEPPIDPALLARAAASGVDVAAVVSGLDQPLPLVRFTVLAQKAAELASEVKALGGTLLSALEKEDGEALAALRSRHERALLDLTEQVRYTQLQESTKAREALEGSLAQAAHRYAYYERQLGRSAEEVSKAVPKLAELDAEALAKLAFTAAEPALTPRGIDADLATGVFAQVAGFLAGGKLLSSYEVRETLLLETAQIATDIGNALSVGASLASVLPQLSVDLTPWGIGGSLSFGGSNIGSGIQATAGAARGIADRLNFEARRAARIDGFARREREWALQSGLAALEINQIFKQLRAAQLREAIARQELRNHRKQKEQAAEVELFLNENGTERAGKTTNKALYAWLRREVRGLYAQYFQLAFDVAKKAEQCLRHELGDATLSYLSQGHPAGREGLLAGERLHLDVKRMELAYLELNRREYELTKHVSLLQVNPLALVELRAAGTCTVSLDEALFDLDGPGHYFRRIRGVAVSVPCVTGPYAGVACTLTLQSSRIRVTATVGDGEAYAYQGPDDDRFSGFHGGLRSIVTSSGQNDAGMFDPNAPDERYRPFENSGVISTWQLRLPADPGAGEPTSFDYDSIGDVILHLRYTARADDALRGAAMADLKDKIAKARAVGSQRLFSLRHEFPSAWAAFTAAPAAANASRPLTVTLTERHLPFWSASLSKPAVIRAARLIVRSEEEVKVAGPAGSEATTDTLGPYLTGLRSTVLTKAPIPVLGVDWTVRLFDENREITDAWLVVDWGAPDDEDH